MLSWFQSDERRHTAVLFVGSMVVLAAVIVLVIIPQYRGLEELKDRSLRLEADLAPYMRLARERPLHVQIDRARMRYLRQEEEFQRIIRQINTFEDGSPLQATLPSPEEGRIDFKVALFNARSLVTRRAAGSRVSLPADLGMEETIGADENAEIRLWQLASVVKLLNTMIDINVPSIESIQPMRPLVHPIPNDFAPVVREFPVRIVVRCSFERLLELTRRLTEGPNAFIIRRFMVELLPPGGDHALEVDIICSAGLLRALSPPGREVESVAHGMPATLIDTGDRR